MSKIKVNEIEKVSGSGITIPTGTSFTVTDGIPATNLSGTIADARLPTVPVTKGGTGLTSLGSAGQAVKVNAAGNALEFGAVAGGKVLQVVQTKFTGNSITTTSNSFQNFGYTRTITLSATTSKVFGIVTMNGFWITNTGANAIVNIQRQISGGSNTDLTSQNLGLAHTYNTDAITASFSFLDTPNTTSEITYNPRFRSDNSSYNAYVHRGNAESSILLMEIGA
jgi:hypothetical protein